MFLFYISHEFHVWNMIYDTHCSNEWILKITDSFLLDIQLWNIRNFAWRHIWLLLEHFLQYKLFRLFCCAVCFMIGSHLLNIKVVKVDC